MEDTKLIFRYIRKNNLKKVKQLIENGYPINTCDYFGDTALHVAADGHLEICEYLINKNAKVNFQNKYGNTPLHVAVEGNYYDVCELLLKNNANIDLKNYRWDKTMELTRNVEIRKLLSFYDKNSPYLKTIRINKKL